jgi:hypothetical protein
MKFIVPIVAASLAFTACVSPPAREPRTVRFQIVQAFDAPGDLIELEAVTCDRARLEEGATLRVRGHCRLSSADHAQLYFGLTNGEGVMSPLVELVPGERSFDLTMHVTRVGMPHVSMYAGPVVNGGNCIGKRRFEILAE